MRVIEGHASSSLTEWLNWRVSDEQGSLKTLEKSWNNPGKVLERPRSTTEDTDIETVVAICTLFSLSRFKPDVFCCCSSSIDFLKIYCKKIKNMTDKSFCADTHKVFCPPVSYTDEPVTLEAHCRFRRWKSNASLFLIR